MVVPNSQADQQDRVLGQLFLSVKEGRSFALEETSDVYCVIQLENQQIQTSICSKLQAKSQPTWNEGYNFDVTTPDASIFIGVWIKSGTQQEGKCVGTVSIPVKSIGHTHPDKSQRINDHSSSHRSHVWVPVSNSVHPGAQLLCDLYYNSAKQKVGLEDFTVLKQLGRGAFGDVMLVQKKDTGTLYAMKVCKKERIISMDVVDLALKERNLIKSFNHPFVVSLKFSFKTRRHLFLIMDYIGGGELFYHMAEQRSFNEGVVRFYAAQLVLALGFLHEHNIIYRDLKPENLLLDIRGNICLCDFGLCKEQHATELAFTMCGSTEYMSPEALRGKGYGKEVDWWALGVVLYEMLTGRCLFQGPSKPDVHHNILYGPIPFSDSISKNAMSLIINLLKRDPTKRLGYGPKGAEDIKAHPFFNGVDWKKTLHREIEPPFKPHLIGTMDLKYFDPSCTEAVPEIAASPRLDSLDENFGAFSYVAPLEVFRADHGIQFLKGASFGKLPLFPHLERNHSNSPHSWNPLSDCRAPSPRLHHSFSNSRDGSSPKLSIMMANTPPSSSFELTSASPTNSSTINSSLHSRKPNLSINLPSEFERYSSSPHSPPSPTGFKLRRPFSVPDSSSSPHTSMRLGHSTIGHSQSRLMKSDDGEDEGSTILMQQTYHTPEEKEEKEEKGEKGEKGEKNDEGITPRRSPRLSLSTSAITGKRDSVSGVEGLKKGSKEDRGLRKSFKDMFTGLFNNNKRKSMSLQSSGGVNPS